MVMVRVAPFLTNSVGTVPLYVDARIVYVNYKFLVIS